MQNILFVAVGAAVAWVVFRAGALPGAAPVAGSKEQAIYTKTPLDRTIDLATLFLFTMLALIAVKGLGAVKSIV